MRRSTIDEYVVGDKIGRGTFGAVYCARRRDDAAAAGAQGEARWPLAYKEFRADDAAEASGVPLDAIRELAHLQLGVGHAHLVQFHSIVYDGDDDDGCAMMRGYVMRRMTYDVGSWLDAAHPHGLPAPLLCSCARQLLLALAHCHTVLDLCHRDVKPKNCLVHAATCHLQLADFGSSRRGPGVRNAVARAPCDDDAMGCTLACGTPFYRAPETLLGSPEVGVRIGPEVDLWSSACTVYEMATNTPLFWSRKDKPGGRRASGATRRFEELLAVVGTLYALDRRSGTARALAPDAWLPSTLQHNERVSELIVRLLGADTPNRVYSARRRLPALECVRWLEQGTRDTTVRLCPP